MGGGVGVQTSYLVTPTWVEVGLDWIELKLGWMLGWVVTTINIIKTRNFPPRSAQGPSGGVPGEVIFYFHFSAYQHLRCSLIVPTQNTYICPSPTGGPMAPWGHWPIGPLTLSQPHFEGGVDT